MIIKNYIPTLTEKDIRRFFNKVLLPKDNNSDLCWEWGRSKNIGGYGNFDIKDFTYRAHRVSYFIHYKVDPLQLCVCHKCDNPSCVNPKHLFLGTDKDNVHDMHRKGRFSKREGIFGTRSKLNVEQVSDIRDSFKSGISVVQLSKMYNVTTTLILNVIKNKTYKNIDTNYVIPPIKSGNNKLNKEDVLYIRNKIKSESALKLAKQYNVTKNSIYNIINRSTWSDV